MGMAPRRRRGPVRGSAAVFEFRKPLERVLGGARQLDGVPAVLDLQALVRHGDQVRTEAEEPADLEHREQITMAIDNDVVDRSDLFFLFVNDAGADKSRSPVP